MPGEYTIAGGLTDAQRLARQAHVMAGATQRFLDGVGLTTGWSWPRPSSRPKSTRWRAGGPRAEGEGGKFRYIRAFYDPDEALRAAGLASLVT